MDKIKQALLVYINQTKNFLLKKDENSKVKYKNLTVCLVGLAVFLVICIMLVPSKHNNNTMMLHPDDMSSSNEEVSFDDNNAVAVSPTIDDSALQIPNNPQQTDYTQKDELTDSSEYEENIPGEEDLDNAAKVQPQDDITPVQNLNNTKDESVNTQSTINQNHFLYCGKFSSKEKASEQKATLAFSAGFISSVEKKNGVFTLKLGPFENRDAAVKAFEKMDKLSLVDECQLEKE